MSEWVCDYCGTTGHTRPGETTDHVQCPVCGEPVVPARNARRAEGTG